MSFLRSFSLILCAAGLLTVSAAAQDADVDPGINVRPDTGGQQGTRALGNLVAGPFDLEVATGDNLQLGVDAAWGFYWITSRDDIGAGGSGPGPAIYQYDLLGNLVASYDQVTNSPTWGQRDLAADEANNLLYAGAENGELAEYAYDPSTQSIAWVQTYTIPVGQTVRALARNPADGHFFTASFSSSVYEFDLAGTIYNNWPNPGTAAYGMAWDTANNTLWMCGQDDNGSGNLVHLSEYDPVTMAFTCREFWGYDNAGFANIAGGCDFYNDSRNPNGWSIVALHQTTPDSIAVYDAVGPPPPPTPAVWNVNLPTSFVPAAGMVEGFEAYGGTVPPHMAVTEIDPATGLPDPEAWANIGQHGPTNAGGASPPYAGTYCLEMGLDPFSSNYHDVRNSLVIGLDGGGNTQLYLDFWAIDHGDEADAIDGVWVSSDGVNWHQVFGPWTPLTSTWQAVTGVALHGEPCANGVDLSGQFYMMLAQEDNFPIGYLDGVQVDDLTIRPGGPALDLTVTGTCPGQMTFTVTGSTPGGMIAYVYGPAGSYTWTGSPCGGTVLDINPPVIGAYTTATSVTMRVCRNLCGVTRVQAVDVSTCTVSNYVDL